MSDKNVSSCDFLQKMLIFYHVAKIPNGKSLSTKTLVWMGLVGGQQTFYFKWRDKLSDSHQNLTFGSYLCVIVFSYIHKSYFSYSHPGKLSRLKLKSELFFEKPQIEDSTLISYERNLVAHWDGNKYYCNDKKKTFFLIAAINSWNYPYPPSYLSIHLFILQTLDFFLK